MPRYAPFDWKFPKQKALNMNAILCLRLSAYAFTNALVETRVPEEHTSRSR